LEPPYPASPLLIQENLNNKIVIKEKRQKL